MRVRHSLDHSPVKPQIEARNIKSFESITLLMVGDYIQLVRSRSFSTGQQSPTPTPHVFLALIDDESR